jgi:hypothetical protein
MTEAEVVELLRSRTGRATRVIATDGEPIEVRDIVQVTASPSVESEYSHYAGRGGIPLTADGGRYFFYSNEIDRVEDVETGEVILTRQYR